MRPIGELLDRSAALHRHLCPRQVLGVRIGLCGGAALGLEVPRTDKRLVVFAETDGCGADGISVATGCWVGRRTLRVFDFGKLAATFADTRTGQAVRVAPRSNIRESAWGYASDAPNRWMAQLRGYRLMPDDELLRVQPVRLNVDLDALMNRRQRVICADCGEEIINERHLERAGRVLCRTCTGEAYFTEMVTEAFILTPEALPKAVEGFT